MTPLLGGGRKSWYIIIFEKIYARLSILRFWILMLLILMFLLMFHIF